MLTGRHDDARRWNDIPKPIGTLIPRAGAPKALAVATLPPQTKGTGRFSARWEPTADGARHGVSCGLPGHLLVVAPPLQWMPPLYRSPRWAASSLCARSRYRRPNRRVAATPRHWSSFRSAQPPAATAAAARRTVPHAQLPSQPLKTTQWSGSGPPGWRCLHSSRRTRSFARECRRNSRSRRYLLSGVCSAPLQHPPSSLLAS